MKLKKWRLIDTGIASAQYNMAVDEALLYSFKEYDLPILRLYRWESSISLGRFSNLLQSIDLKTLQKQNLSFVRRMTGGGILVHGGDLSYSLILPRKYLKDTGVKESYRYLCGFLINLYAKLGLSADFASNLKLPTSKSNICMSANEPYDIIIDGKKIGGNAQRYSKEVLFQHGSIPMSLDNTCFKNIFLEESALEDVTTLEKIGTLVTYEELQTFLLEAFIDTFNVRLIKDDLNPSQIQRVEKLLEQKYTNKRWNIDAKQN